jgi:hypothetical protein
MYAESDKKGLENKRGRFNEGEKKVVARSIESKLTTTSGTVVWNANKTRTESADTRTVGSEFVGKYALTIQEWEHLTNQAKLLLPPHGIKTTFNGEVVRYRKDVGQFTEKLPCPLADKEGNVRNVERQAIVHIYELRPGETQAFIFEMGIPIVELRQSRDRADRKPDEPTARVCQQERYPAISTPCECLHEQRQDKRCGQNKRRCPHDGRRNRRLPCKYGLQIVSGRQRESPSQGKNSPTLDGRLR